jgi:hypothetical protein
MHKLFIAVLAVTSLDVCSVAMAAEPGRCDAIYTHCNNICVKITETSAQTDCWTQCSQGYDLCTNSTKPGGGLRIGGAAGKGTGVPILNGGSLVSAGTNVKGPANTGGGAALSATFGTAASASTLGKVSGPASIATKPLPAISATIGDGTMGGSRNSGRTNLRAQ